MKVSGPQSLELFIKRAEACHERLDRPGLKKLKSSLNKSEADGDLSPTLALPIRHWLRSLIDSIGE